VFPRSHDPRIFWTGLGGDLGALKQLVNDIDLALKDIGFPRENREFRPHVTVAKPKGERSSKEDTDRFCKLIENYQSPMFDISSIAIVKSQLGPSGSRYSVLETIDLKARA
jgi:2'-5' RNA ligase